MSLFPLALATALLAGAAACSESSMSGSSGRRPSDKPVKTGTETSTSTTTPPHETADAGAKLPPRTATAVADDVDTGVAIPPPVTGTTTSVSTTPDEIVDGQEVINDCRRCVARAKELSPKAGFTADIARTRNMHFYKIDPARNLCDIHFMRSMSDPIADHEGRDSVLENQVALYCPCNCGWAASGEDDEGFRP